MDKTSPIIIIGQNYCTSLGIIDALGEAGYRCELAKRIGVWKPHFCPDLRSKYVDKAMFIKVDDDDKMTSFLINNYSENSKKKLIIPSDDFSAALLDRNLDKLSDFFIFPNVKNKEGALSKYMNKMLQKEIATKCNMSVTSSCIIEVIRGKHITIPSNIQFPCFTKPHTSIMNPKTYCKKIDSYDELQKFLLEVADEREACNIIVEQYVDAIKEYTIPCLSIGENVIIPAVIEKIRIGKGEHSGVTISGKVLDINTVGEYAKYISKFIQHIGFQGICDIELIRSKEKIYFNEINLRNGAAAYSVTKSGINLPATYADYIFERKSLKNNNHDFKFNSIFVNEKAALDNYISGFSSFNTLYKTLKYADIHFLLKKSDITAMISFSLLFCSNVLKKIIKTKIYNDR